MASGFEGLVWLAGSAGYAIDELVAEMAEYLVAGAPQGEEWLGPLIEHPPGSEVFVHSVVLGCDRDQARELERAGGKVLRRRQDRCTGNALSASATIEHIDDHGTEVGDIKVEAQRSTSFERRPLESATGERREAELVNQYKEFRRDQGHAVRNRSIRLPGQSHPLRTDLYDETTNDLCEAKSSASRRDIRYALGQILDYGRHVPHDTLSVLVPVEPTPDLVRLLHASDVACVFKGRDSFIRLDPD